MTERLDSTQIQKPQSADDGTASEMAPKGNINLSHKMMEHALKGVLNNEGMAKYAIPGSLVVGGCLLLYTGYTLGTRKSKIGKKENVEKENGEALGDAQGGALKRVMSERSLASEDSPVGDNYRCALIVRKDCGLARGKMIIHCCRAFLAEFKKLYKSKDPDLKEWERDGMTVVVLRAESDQDLVSLKAKAMEMHVTSHTFASKQADGNALRTVMALGPSKSSMIKELTQHLLRL